jgi:cytochrome P450
MPVIDSVVEEVLRLEAVAPFLPKVTRESVEICGSLIPAGSHVLVVLGAANRDPTRFDSPDVFDVDRPPTAHWTFGQGIHRCIGLHLARLEMRVVLEEFHKRIPNYELTSGQTLVATFPGATVGLKTLRLTFLGTKGC